MRFCRCGFREKNFCLVTSKITGLPIAQCPVQPETCAACRRTPTPDDGAPNKVTIDVGLYHLKRHAPQDVESYVERFDGFLRLKQAGGMKMMGMARRYAAAITRWVGAGCPTRSDEEVALIFKSACQPCSHFKQLDNGEAQCTDCGCGLSTHGGALSNKIRMATEHCSYGGW